MTIQSLPKNLRIIKMQGGLGMEVKLIRMTLKTLTLAKKQNKMKKDQRKIFMKNK